MERNLKVKMGARSVAEDRVRPQTLSTNILEAMLQDVSQGSNDNADAGFELMSEPYHTIYDRSPPPGLGNGIPKEWEHFTVQDGSSLGVQHVLVMEPRLRIGIPRFTNVLVQAPGANSPPVPRRGQPRRLPVAAGGLPVHPHATYDHGEVGWRQRKVAGRAQNGRVWPTGASQNPW